MPLDFLVENKTTTGDAQSITTTYFVPIETNNRRGKKMVQGHLEGEGFEPVRDAGVDMEGYPIKYRRAHELTSSPITVEDEVEHLFNGNEGAGYQATLRVRWTGEKPPTADEVCGHMVNRLEQTIQIAFFPID